MKVLFYLFKYHSLVFRDGIIFSAPEQKLRCAYVMVEVQEYFCCLFRFRFGATLQFAWVVIAVWLDVQSTGERACSAVARCSRSDMHALLFAPLPRLAVEFGWRSPAVQPPQKIGCVLVQYSAWEYPAAVRLG